ncbi:hypothetical protein ANCCEY_04233 [Ancylostoma ceylanicum]|uniref:Uncharacterized protein n=1 Tax=Ancylostoma ceylanicum TaxID=53326 RepID=A0A0D6M2X6_9BILA|nr:hypothetical protein ANCCEY_04233 [Ancylostoma ceylanicum]
MSMKIPYHRHEYWLSCMMVVVVTDLIEYVRSWLRVVIVMHDDREGKHIRTGDGADPHVLKLTSYLDPSVDLLAEKHEKHLEFEILGIEHTLSTQEEDQ